MPDGIFKYLDSLSAQENNWNIMALSSSQSLVLRERVGWRRDRERKKARNMGQVYRERAEWKQGNTEWVKRSFTPEKLALLFEPSFLNGVGLCDSQQKTKIK